MEFISQSTNAKPSSESECNQALSYYHQPLPEAASIYGGVGTVALRAPHLVSSATTAEGKINPWSPSLQNLLDQPPATLPPTSNHWGHGFLLCLWHLGLVRTN